MHFPHRLQFKRQHMINYLIVIFFNFRGGSLFFFYFFLFQRGIFNKPLKNHTMILAIKLAIY